MRDGCNRLANTISGVDGVDGTGQFWPRQKQKPETD